MQEPRIILAAVLKENGEIAMRKLGRIAQDKRCDRTLSPEDTAIWNHLAENGGGHLLARAARQYEDHRLEQVRRNGGTIITTTSLHGRTTTARRTFPPPKAATIAPPSRMRSCSRTARPRERRSSASSTTSSADPGADSDLPAPAPAARPLAPRGAAHRVATAWLLVGSTLLEREARR